jgi:UDP-glucose 4-epimerase
VFGNDYSTHDGTCVRDYIHVTDLAQAHLLGVEQMQKTKGFSAYNLGNGSGFSVLDVIKSCEKVVGHEIGYEIDDRRVGDPDILVADSSRATDFLGWRPEFDQLDSIVDSAWNWHASSNV